jgi:flagellar protein FlaG
MASVSVSHMILFIASMLIAASVAGVFTETVGQLSSAIDDQGLQVSEDVRTDVEIISDSSVDAYNDTHLRLHVKNTGSEPLVPVTDEINLFVDGRFVPADDVSVKLLSDGDLWRPGDVVRVDVTDDSFGISGDVRVKLVVNGDEEVFEFRT